MEAADPVAVLQGLELARILVERTGVRDPQALRAAAARIESCATSPLELACARGFRIVAAEQEER